MSQPIELASAKTLQRVLIRTHRMKLGSTILSKKGFSVTPSVFLQSSVLQKQHVPPDSVQEEKKKHHTEAFELIFTEDSRSSAASKLPPKQN